MPTRWSRRMRPFGTTIFAEMSALAVRTGAVNLGQGFPDTDGPPEMLRGGGRGAARRGTTSTRPAPASPALRAAVAAHQRRFWGLEYDPDGEVLVTAGATEAVAASDPRPLRAGRRGGLLRAVLRLVRRLDRAGRRRPPAGHAAPGADGRYAFDPAELRAAFGAAHPAGAAQLAAQPDRQGLHPRRAGPGRRAVPGARRVRGHRRGLRAPGLHRRRAPPHVPLATLPGMRERTLRISSAGKTFSCTGWKVGWASGPAPLVSAVLRVKQFLTFVNGGAAAAGGRGRARPAGRVLHRASAPACRRGATSSSPASPRPASSVLRPEGTYFVTADITPAGRPRRGRVLPRPAGALRRGGGADPGLLRRREAGRRLVRFAFCKRPEVLAEAVTRRPRA